MQIGTTVQQTVVEELRLGAEPAVTLHQLTVEQNVWEMLLKRSLATPTPVQVTDFMFLIHKLLMLDEKRLKHYMASFLYYFNVGGGCSRAMIFE